VPESGRGPSVPPEPFGFRGRAAARCRTARRTPLALTWAPSAPPAGSAYSVRRSLFAVSTALRDSRRRASPRAEARFECRSCPWLASGVSGLRIPSPSVAKGTGSPGFRPLRHKPARRIRLTRGFHAPAPSALRVWLPSRRFSPRQAWRRPVDRRSVHGVLPSGPCASRSAVPLSRPRLSCRFSARGRSPDRPRLQRLAPTGKGNVGFCPKTGAVEPCPLGCSPLQGILLHRLWTGFPARSPSRPSGRKCSLRFHFRAGPQGFECGESGWSLSRLPALMGFCTFPNPRAS
jgi:hypothetical protein